MAGSCCTWLANCLLAVCIQRALRTLPPYMCLPVLKQVFVRTLANLRGSCGRRWGRPERGFPDVERGKDACPVCLVLQVVRPPEQAAVALKDLCRGDVGLQASEEETLAEAELPFLQQPLLLLSY